MQLACRVPPFTALMASDWALAQVCVREPAGSTPAGFAFVGCGDPLMPLLPFKAVLIGRAGKSGRPPLLEPSLKVQRDIAHNQSSGFAVKGLIARWPLKVHPNVVLNQRWRSVRWPGLAAHESPRIPGSPAALLESWRGICGRRSLSQRVRPPASATPRPFP
jgi:hypothetical protein